jgi:hypothetical protein
MSDFIHKRPMRVLDLAEVRYAHDGCYEDCADLSNIFNHPIVEVAEGDSKIWRWKPNALIEYVLGRPVDIFGGGKHKIDLNDLCMEYCRGGFPIEEYMKFNMDHGYSLCGFCDVFSQDVIAKVIKAHRDDPRGWMIARADVKRGER